MKITWYEAKQYELCSVSIRPCEMEMTEVVMRLEHSDPECDTVVVKMCMDDSGEHALRSYTTNFPFHKAAPLVSDEMTDNCEDFARELLIWLEG